MDTYMSVDKPDSIDLSHHLSVLARSRLASPLKGMYKYFKPDIAMLAGGLPSPEYFPFESISAEVPAANTFKVRQSTFGWVMDMIRGKTKTITVPKWPSKPDELSLSTALQYSTAEGMPALLKFTYDFTARVYQPATADFKTLMCCGSTDAWGKIVTTLCNRGDGVLCEEWTYSSALSTAWPNGIKPVAVDMDGEGIIPAAFESLLRDWDPTKRGGMQRPRVLYTIPICQNPTGATLTVKRKQAIYAICKAFDVIIVEDDPYYFLQTGDYTRLQSRTKEVTAKDDDAWIDTLVPSYLKFDSEGRVIRIDTFSKTICPGSRLGWITCNPLFAERLLRASESSSGAPCGFVQALVSKLLVEHWGQAGYIRWLKGLQAQYTLRRDTMIDALLDQAHAGLDARAVNEPSTFAWCTDDASAEKGKQLLSFVAPQGGMFVWLRVHLSNHPDFSTTNTADLLIKLWEKIAEAKVLVAPGNMFNARTFGSGNEEPPFAPPQYSVRLTSEEDESAHELMLTPEGDGYFRIAFSSADKATMLHGARVLGQQVKRFFEN